MTPSFRISDKANEALVRNRELIQLWVSVARVVRFGEAPGLRDVVHALTACGLQETVFSCFWPQCCVTRSANHVIDEAPPVIEGVENLGGAVIDPEVAQLTADEGVHDYAVAFLATAIGAGYMSGGDRNEDNTRDIVKIGGLLHAMNGDGFGIIEGAVSGRDWGGMFDRLDALRTAGKMRAESGDAEGAMRNEGRVEEEMKR